MKFIISFFLKYVPRKYLQLFSHVVLKIAVIFYQGNKVACPVCESKFRKFMPYGRTSRSNALCPNCLALERHRLIWLYLQRKTDFFTAKAKMLHIAPELCYIDRFKALEHLDYITADIESPLAQVKMDIHEIPFVDDTFDIIFCNHVLEHVADDLKAMTEMRRVLKPSGWAIVQIPWFSPILDVTFEDASIIDPREREKIFGQNDHVRLYGKDYSDRLRGVGFNVIEERLVMEMDKEELEYFALPKEEIIYRVQKAR